MSIRRGRATGPRSSRGKARASTNAARHGLTGTALVLPGETIEAYTANQEVWFAALDPRNGAEGQLVAQIADVAWRLDRCSRIEHELLRAEVEVTMRKTMAWKSASALKNTLEALRALLRAFEHEGRGGERLREISEIVGLLAPSRKVIEMVRDVDGAPEEAVLPLETALNELERKASNAGAGMPDLAAVFCAAKAVAEHVEKALQASADKMDEFTKKAAALTVPDADDTKKMSRYRAELERSMTRLLGVLEEVRGASRGRRRKNGSSFRDGNSAHVFRLRVVR